MAMPEPKGGPRDPLEFEQVPRPDPDRDPARPDLTHPDLSRAERRTPLYLARASYRQRRWIDAHRLLPVLLFFLYLLPLLWGGDDTGEPVGRGVRSVVYLFAIWGLAIVGSVVFAVAMQRKVAQAPPIPKGGQGAKASQGERRGENTAPAGPDHKED